MANLKTSNDANTKNIFSHLFDQMHKLNAKLISVEEAKAQSNLCKQANNVLKYELDRSVAKAKWGDELELRDIEQNN